jgi:hypothetical protein
MPLPRPTAPPAAPAPPTARDALAAGLAFALALLLAVPGCNCRETDSQLVLSNEAPLVAIIQPQPGTDGAPVPFALGEGIVFVAAVQDDDSVAELAVAWSAVQTDAPGSDPLDLGSSSVDAEGFTSIVANALTAGRWLVTATATDGDGATGDASIAVLVTGQNQAPEVVITSPVSDALYTEGDSIPFAATTGDDAGSAQLVAEWYSDVDGVLDSAPPSLAGLLTFSTDTLSLGEHTVTVTVVDGGGLQASDQVTLSVAPSDLPPTTPTVTIEPAAPLGSDDLLCIVTIASTDPEGLPVTHEFSWLVDGSPTSITESSVPAGQTSSGQEWTCVVRGNDGSLDSEPGSASVTVGNTPPSIEEVALGPSPAYETSVLICAPSGWLDEDGDSETYEYSWTINGVPLGSSAASATLDGSFFSRDDLVTCVVTPTDGIDAGEPVESGAVLIENSPPTPPTVSVTPSPSASTQDALLCVALGGSDDDPADSISYELEWWLDGVHQPAYDGLSNIPASATSLGQTWSCRMRTSDGTASSDWVEDSTQILPQAGDLVIDEAMIDPYAVSDAAGEWVEIYNRSGEALDLLGFELHDDGSDSHVIAESVILPAGGRAVLARNEDASSNGGVAADYEYSGFALDNDSDEIVLSYGGVEVDRFEYALSYWSGGLSGQSATLDGALGTPDPLVNDDPDNWCGSTLPITSPGSDFGTPGAANDDCACFDSDGDGDGFGDSATCALDDCNDANAAINPAATDVCENGVDEDCSGADATCSCASTDGDGDGYGDGAACSPVDCNDANSNVNPGATETCNGIDDDCDAVTDEGFDNDGDGWTTCEGDCNDFASSVHPGAVETCNGVNDDCDAQVDEGFDGDGDGYTSCGGDCNDGNANINPAELDVCNGVNDDCDASTDENAAGDSYEPNDTSSAAYYIGGDDSSLTIYGTMHLSTDNSDWYWINTIDDTDVICDLFNIQVSLESIPSGADYDVYLYDGDLSLLDWSANTSNDDENIAWSSGCLAWEDNGGPYYVRVKRWSGWNCSDTYRLEVSNSN